MIITNTEKMATMKTNGTSRKPTLFSHIRYEHLVAGFSGGVTSTLILHPLDLIKIRFAGKYYNWQFIVGIWLQMKRHLY